MAGKIMTDQAKMRKLHGNLSICGTGIIVFGICSLISNLILTYDHRFDLGFFWGLGETYDTDDLIVAVIFITICTIAALTLRIYVGLSSVRISRGLSGGSVYTKAAIVMAAIYLIAVILDIYDIFQAVDPNELLSDISTFLIDLTSMIISFDIVHINHMLKKISVINTTGKTNAG